MGVQFDRILEPFTGPFEKVTDWNVKPPPGRVTRAGARHAVIDSIPRINDSVNRRQPAAGRWRRRCTWTIEYAVNVKSTTLARVQEIAKTVGLNFEAGAGRAAIRAETARTADRALGSVRRLDRVRLDALDPRAVRVSVRSRVTRRRSTPAA